MLLNYRCDSVRLTPEASRIPHPALLRSAPVRPSAHSPPACVSVFRPELRRNSSRGDRCSLLYLCWVLTPPAFQPGRRRQLKASEREFGSKYVTEHQFVQNFYCIKVTIPASNFVFVTFEQKLIGTVELYFIK